MALVATCRVHLPVHPVQDQVVPPVGHLSIGAITQLGGRRHRNLPTMAIRAERGSVAGGAGSRILVRLEAMVFHKGRGVIEGLESLEATLHGFGSMAIRAERSTRLQCLGVGGGEARLW